MTLDNFTPLFYIFFINILVLVPILIVFYFTYLFLEKKGFDSRKAKMILSLVTICCFSVFFIYLILLAGGSFLTIRSLTVSFAYLLPFISGIIYYRLEAHSNIQADNADQNSL